MRYQSSCTVNETASWFVIDRFNLGQQHFSSKPSEQREKKEHVNKLTENPIATLILSYTYYCFTNMTIVYKRKVYARFVS